MAEEKRIYDAAMRRRLAGCLPFEKDASVPFSLEDHMDLPDDIRPILHIGTFSEEDKKVILNDFAKDKSITFDEMLVKVMSGSGIRSWENIRNLVTEEELKLTPENVEKMKDSVLLREAYTRAAEFSGIFTPPKPGKLEQEALG